MYIKKSFTEYLSILFIVGVMVLIACSVPAITQSDKEIIETMIETEYGGQVESIDRVFFGHPFWVVDDNDRIYKATVIIDDQTKTIYAKRYVLGTALQEE